MIYFTSDLHFGHKNVIKYENRPFEGVGEMNKILIENWNDTVTNKDDVYILGDFSFHGVEATKSIIGKLNGQKYLIFGNHDHVCKKSSVKEMFAWTKDYYTLKYNNIKFILFHYPIASWDCKHHGSIHLHGHVHSRPEYNKFLQDNFKNMYNVGADCNNYKPISIDEILRRLNYEKEQMP